MLRALIENVGMLIKNARTLIETIATFKENVGTFIKNVATFKETVGTFIENVVMFKEKLLFLPCVCESLSKCAGKLYSIASHFLDNTGVNVVFDDLS